MTDEILSDYRDEITSFFQSMAGAIYGFLRRLCQGDTQLCEDLVQETFKKAWGNWPVWRDLTEGQRVSSLMNVALYTAINHFRHEETVRRKWPQVYMHYGPTEVDVPRDAMTTIAIEHLIKVIEEMPPERAKVAFLFWRCGWTNQEIAAALGITPGRVSQQVKAARATLKNELGPYVPFEPSDPKGGASL
jgi:RNA polymerase sigma factor (sigma-70 family)